MTAKAKPNRIPKGSKEGGRAMPKWAAELRERTEANCGSITELWDAVGRTNEKIGTSTPLIIWNIAVLIAIAYLYCKAYVPGTP